MRSPGAPLSRAFISLPVLNTGSMSFRAADNDPSFWIVTTPGLSDLYAKSTEAAQLHSIARLTDAA